MSKPVKVSVLMITYNHSPFIEQALESVLAQQTSFSYELIIGEDDSSDGTRQTVERYAIQHPDKIVLNLRNRAETLSYPDETPGTRNFTSSLPLARGEYIAILEGDDYWTDPYKLQRQVDVFENHRDVVICCHGVELLCEHDQRRESAYAPWADKQRGTLQEILRGNLVQTATVMYRHHVVNDYPQWFHNMPAPDWANYVMLLDRTGGSIYYLDEIMAVHRIHAGGIWGSKSREQICDLTVKGAQILDKGLNYRYHLELNQAVAAALVEKSELLEQRGDFYAALLTLYRLWSETKRFRFLPLARFLRLHYQAAKAVVLKK